MERFTKSVEEMNNSRKEDIAAVALNLAKAVADRDHKFETLSSRVTKVEQKQYWFAGFGFSAGWLVANWRAVTAFLSGGQNG